MEHAETVTFAGAGLDRAAGLRCDADAFARLCAEPGTRALPVWRGKPLIAGDARDRLGWVQPSDAVLVRHGAAPILLGRDADGAGRIAVDISAWDGPEAPTLGAFLDPSEQVHPGLPADTRFVELRAAMARLSRQDAEWAACARALSVWHRSHGFCAACGAQSAPSLAGWQRTCPDCGTRHFPRTDPVVIMLVTRGNAVLVGRSPGWPEGMHSLLAGFVEPGETVEAAVRREVFEEAGIEIGRVRYLASQPWPFPASLMLGCAAEALSEEITVDPAEIEAARWVAREEMVEVLAGRHPDLTPPRRGAIARFLVEAWLADRLD